MGLKEFRWTKVIQFVNHMIPLLMLNNWHWFLWTYIIKDGRFLFKKDFHCNWTSFINASNSSVWWHRFVRKSLLVHFKLSKLSVKANLNFELQARNPTTGMKSYQYRGKMSNKILQTNVFLGGGGGARALIK